VQPHLKRAVLAWGERHRRDLPWRRTRDPWAVLVSELMLQQTQATRVAPRYRAFIARFPTPAACARAPRAAVVRAWDGLGYNRRALHVHRAAAVLAEAGRFPDTVEGLQRLAGVGPYTARAVLAFAFERDAAVVDTNVARVLARVHGRPLSPREAQAAADAALVPGQAWAWNQAMMDIGAVLCRSRTPACTACPLAPACQWYAAGSSPPDPAETASRQEAFAGSNRQGRGRLVRALRHAPVARVEAASVMGWTDDPERVDRVVAGLVAEGLVAVDGRRLRLA
jgi:A/G-specific adenine glycosylase